MADTSINTASFAGVVGDHAKCWIYIWIRADKAVAAALYTLLGEIDALRVQVEDLRGHVEAIRGACEPRSPTPEEAVS
jgi:hypothetical protein